MWRVRQVGWERGEGGGEKGVKVVEKDGGEGGVEKLLELGAVAGHDLVAA